MNKMVTILIMLFFTTSYAQMPANTTSAQKENLKTLPTTKQIEDCNATDIDSIHPAAGQKIPDLEIERLRG